jgi:O-antigen ligase
MTNRLVLTLVFTLSFMTYMTPDLSTSVQLAPLVLFAALVFVKVLSSNAVLDAVWSLFELDGLVFVLLISILTIAPSVASDSEKSFEAALIISVCLILARLYMVLVSIREVFEAFFWSAIVSIVFFICLAFASLVQSIRTFERLSPFSFHPNLLGFLVAGYFCAMVWKFISGDWRMKLLTAPFGFLCLVITFFASSRGSLVGILAGCLFVAGIATAGAKKQTRKKVLRFGLSAAAVLFGLFLYIQNSDSIRNTYEFVDQVLQLSQADRGIDSGLTGRLDKWNATMNGVSDGSWLVGKGFRSSDSMQDNLIDNSYLVILYEIGFVPLILITWRFLHLSLRFVMGSFQPVGKDQRYFCLACGLFMTIFLVNNIVARFLFSMGNPFSLAALLLFATPTRLLPSLFNQPGRAQGNSIQVLGPNTQPQC